MSKLRKISYFAWIFLGAFFVFSALAKGLDFFSVSSKIQDYARIFNVTVPKMLYGIGSMALIGAELTIGLLLIKGIFRRYVFFSTLVFLIFFLISTLYVAVSGGLEDCGCFGSVLSATPWMSFTKNVILLLFVILAYPQTLHKTPFKYSDLIICICLTLLLCGSSAFNQPLSDSSKYSVGDKLYINAETQTSIDVDFLPYQKVEISTLGIIRNLNDKSTPELIEALTKTNIKPVVITSMVPKDVDVDIYEHAIVGFMDNTTLNNLISTEFGIITLDNNASIVHKWQKDYLNLQFYTQYKNNHLSFGRIMYMLIWIAILVWSTYSIIVSIKRECRKTHQRVGNLKTISMNLKTIVVTIMFGFIMCACSMDEPKYSCNTEVDEWVKDHVDEIHSMSRANWLESDAEFSIPIYRAFTPEQRINFWREKFQELKALPWSTGELSLIKEAESFFESHLSLFGPNVPTDEQLDDMELFIYKWSEKAKKDYSWSDQMIASIIASGDKLLDTKGTVYQSNRSAGNILLSTSESCNCHIKSMFTCDQYTTCEDANCDGTTLGCGGFLAWSCDGRCEEP